MAIKKDAIMAIVAMVVIVAIYRMKSQKNFADRGNITNLAAETS